jgi:tetratricopeptide (TPR) repeat protein
MPEKTLNEIPRRLRDLYERGSTALQRKNWDYAIEIFGQILQAEPSCYECREALREAQLNKAGASTSLFKRFLGSASNSPVLAKAQFILRNNPVEAINLAEQILNNDGNNAAAHKLLAEAALEADFPRTAVLSLEIALRNAPKDKEIAIRLGQALSRTGQIVRAENVLTELLRAYPNDIPIAQALKNISARRTMSEGGYDGIADGSGSYRDILRDKEKSVTLEQENREYKSVEVIDHLIKEYETRAVSEPDNLKLLRNIAELFARKNDFDRALEYYNLLASKGEADSSLDRAIATTTIKKLDHALAQLDRSDPAYPENVARLEAERKTFQLAECQRRAERYPNDLQIRFELGELYFQAGKISEAIQEFQRAQANPHRRISSLRYLGQCFTRRGLDDVAARTFQNALKEKIVFDEEKKELIYLLGCVLEKTGKLEEAIEHFKQIYEIDIGYKDVAAKIDAYYAGK